GRQFSYVPKSGFLAGKEIMSQKPVNHCFVEFRLHLSISEYCLDLRSKDERMIDNGIIQRFDADAISGKQQSPGSLIPDRKTEHAAKLYHGLFTVFLVEMHNHFGVGLRLEDMSLGLEELAQLAIVIDFPVKDDPYASILIGDRLMASIQVNDREPAKAETDRSRRVVTFVVGTTMFNRVRHPLQQRRRDTPARVKIKFSANPAHEGSPMPLYFSSAKVRQPTAQPKTAFHFSKASRTLSRRSKTRLNGAATARRRRRPAATEAIATRYPNA